MKLQDAKVGEALRDGDGDTWRRTPKGAVLTLTRSNPKHPPIRWKAADFDEAEENFGPFWTAGEVR